MSYFGLNAVNQNQQLDEAASNPAGFNTDVGFFDNSGTAAVSGLYSGLVAKPDQLLWAGMDKIVSPIAKFVNENTSINDTSAEYIAEQRKLAEQQVKRLTPDAATTGTAGQVLHGLFDMGGQAVVGTLLSGPAGGAAAVTGSRFQDCSGSWSGAGCHCWRWHIDPYEPRSTRWWCAGRKCWRTTGENR